jgi:hypothetical protein
MTSKPIGPTLCFVCDSKTSVLSFVFDVMSFDLQDAAPTAAARVQALRSARTKECFKDDLFREPRRLGAADSSF